MSTDNGNVCISVGCRALEDMENHFSMMGNNWQKNIVCGLRKEFDESIQVLKTRKLKAGEREYTFKIRDSEIRIVTKETDKTKALLDAMIRYVSIHSGIKRILCQSCEHEGTDRCLEYYLPTNKKVEKESVYI